MSEPEIPTQSTPNATVLASSLDTNDADKIIVFMNTARSAWGSDPENYRLWGALNLTITMWLWKRLVIDRARGGAGSGKFGAGYSKVAVLSPEQFQRCLMSVSADKAYTDWLVGRLMNERDRSPCYGRIKAIFTKRLAQELGGGDKKFFLPVPSWASR